MLLRTLGVAVLALASCRNTQTSEPPNRSQSTPDPTVTQRPRPALPSSGDVPALPPLRVPGADRVIAIGDLHGDVDATKAALRAAGAIDAQDHWSGGTLVVVQVGDQLDRGDQERAILELFERLTTEATRAGGTFLPLNGNHEVMNVQGDFRYVTPGGYRDFDHAAEALPNHPAVTRIPERARGRVAAFLPGGPYARMLAAHNTVQIVGDTVFVHGGLLPEHVDYGLENINRSVREYLLGTRNELPALLERQDSPYWHRAFALQNDPDTCALAGRTLERANVRRMVIAHTVQEGGINSICDGRVWRVDVGLARHYMGPIEVLEIPRQGTPRVLRGTRS